VCGIAGQFHFAPAKSVDAGLIEKMARILNHRGPDDQGIYVDRNIGLGHVRLSIIDLSPAGHQPMKIENCVHLAHNQPLWIVFNGEIYNFREIREELIRKGHRFHSKTDTEVILHLYEEEGIDCLKRLDGMFAFAIWDPSKERLFLARDRVGKKPLIYSVKEGSITFSSELKALLLNPDFSKEINPISIHHYLTYQYIPSPHTIFSGIKKLPPGHYLLCEKGKIKIDRYWNLNFREKRNISLPDAIHEFKDIFERSVRNRLVSDVPLGAFLSGGVDSSGVVATMARLTSQPVKTFSIGFEEIAFDELRYAREIAGRFKTDHHEWIVKPDVMAILPKLVWHYSEPYADASAIPLFYLSEKARKFVKVVLTGDGGDESFAGYERYLAEKVSRIFNFVPASIRNRVIRPFLDAWPQKNVPRGRMRAMKRILRSYHPDFRREHIQYLEFFDEAQKEELYTDQFSKLTGGIDSFGVVEDFFEKVTGLLPLDQTLYVDSMSYLPDDLMVKTDIATMSVGLEARSPFLDHRLMEFAAALPPSFKMRGFQLKYFLKQAFQNDIPPKLLHRRKMGFGIPLEKWFRGELTDLAKDTLLSERSARRGYFKPAVLKRIYDDHQGGIADHSFRIWALVMLEQWHRMYLDQSLPMSV
jgi:asparagine synthase (glutamine-hydrolysing)